MTQQVFKGVAASVGLITAQAIVVHDVAEARERMTDGAILVCPITTAEWMPVIDRAQGIIAEQGGFVSHSAIVARERRIPCVVGLNGATSLIPDGETVTLDGSTGKVMVGKLDDEAKKATWSEALERGRDGMESTTDRWARHGQ